MHTRHADKLDIHGIIVEFEKTLTENFDVRMNEVSITPADAITAFHQTGSLAKAAELCAARLGLKPHTVPG